MSQAVSRGKEWKQGTRLVTGMALLLSGSELLFSGRSGKVKQKAKCLGQLTVRERMETSLTVGLLACSCWDPDLYSHSGTARQTKESQAVNVQREGKEVLVWTSWNATLWTLTFILASFWEGEADKTSPSGS